MNGFDINDITLGNATASNFFSFGDGIRYSADIDPVVDGIVTIDVAANVATDLGGDPNTAATQVTVNHETVRPTAAVINVPAYVNGPFTATYEFSEDVIGELEANFRVSSNATRSDFTRVDGNTFTALITPTSPGSISLNVDSFAVTDLAQNYNTTSPTVTTTYDPNAPASVIQGVPASVSSAFTVTFEFGEDVTGFTLADITVANGTASDFTTVDGGTYTALITPAAEGNITIDVAANVAQDLAGNSNTAAIQATTTYTILPPTVAISNVPAQSTAPFTATFTFERSVSGFAIGDIVASNAIVSDLAGSGTTYTALISPFTDGTVTINVPADAAQDAAGRGNTAAPQATSSYDGTPPSVVISGTPSITNGQFTATITFSEPVTGFAAGDIVKSNTFLSLTGSGANYTATVSPFADPATLDIPAGVAVDAAGNSNTAATQVVVNFDNSHPSLVIKDVPAQAISAFTATFEFNEDVTDFTLGDIALVNASASDLTAVDGHTYTALITPSGGGDITVNVAADAALDAAGNGNTAANPAFASYDTTPPSLEIQNVPAATNGSFTATFKFSEDVTGFSLADIMISNGTASNLTAVDGSTYTALVTLDVPAGVTVNVGTNVAQDATGNGNTAAAQVSAIYDGVAPTVQLLGAPTLTNQSFSLTVQFSEPVNGFALADITVTNAFATSLADIGGNAYTVLITPLVNGPITIDMAAGVVEDIAGTGNTAATQVTLDFDGTRPTVRILNTPTASNHPFTATFEFSEDVTGFDVNDLTLGNATASDFVAVDANTYTALITLTGPGDIIMDVNAEGAQDAAGNLNWHANRVTVPYDDVRPSVAFSSVQATAAGAYDFRVLFDEVVTGFELSDITVTNGTLSNFTQIGANAYSARLSPVADGVATLNIAANVAQDLVGNDNTAAAQAETIFDITRPTVAIENLPTETATPFTATFKFDEDVTGFNETGITTNNATLSDFTSVDAQTYTALITPTADGTLNISVAAYSAADQAGNQNTASDVASVRVDTTPPTVQILSVPASASAPYTITFEFNEDVTGFALGDIAVTNATTSNFAAIDARTYTALITPLVDNLVTIDVPAGAAQDSLGHSSTAAAQATSDYDLEPPSVSISVPAGVNGQYIATITFSEPVTGFESADVTSTNGHVSVTGSGTTYAATVTPFANPVTLQVPAGGGQDAAGNSNSASTPVETIFDNTKPRPTILNVPTTSNAAFTATIQFDEDVTGFEVGDITVTNGAASDFATVDATTYTALITPAGDGLVTIDVAADVAQDALGNNNSAAATASATIDTVGPTIDINGVPAITDNPYSATFTFSENVTEFTIDDILVDNATVSNFRGGGKDYSALITPLSDGAVTIEVPADVSIDAAGNGNAYSPRATSRYDSVAPTVEITGVPPIVSEPFTATFTFSEDVTDFDISDITLVNATVSGFVIIDATTYRAVVTPIATGSVDVGVAAGAANDTAGNNSEPATTIVTNYDVTPPYLQILNVPLYSSGAFTATFQFTEDVTGFTAGDITLGNATVTAFVAVDAQTYTAEITPIADGAVTVDVHADVAIDVAGNGNVAAAGTAATIDTVAPGVAISGVPANSIAPFTATFTFSEDVTGFVVGDITLGNASASNFTRIDDATYTASIAPITDGTVTIDVGADVAQDAAANGNTAAAQASSSYDGSRPTTTISGVPAQSNTPFTATVTFSEDVSGFDVGDFSVSNGTASTFAAIDGSTYTALITPASDGNVTIDVAADAAHDGAGNGNNAASQAASNYDGTPPAIVISGVPATTTVPFTATFTFSEDVSGFDASDIAVGNGAASAFATIDGATYTALITPAAEGAVTIDVAAAVASDAAGNGNTAATQASSTFDATGPSVTISGASGTINGAFTATFTFSESVTGFTVGDITASNAMITSFAGSGATYTALVTPSFDGAVTLDIAADVATDSFGNGNEAAIQLNVTYDGTGPAIAISGVPPTVNAPFIATFTFAEDVTGFDLGDITVGNGTASSFAAIDSATYNALITPTADGTVTIDVAADAAQDGAGNGNSAASQATTLYDGTPPSIAISGVPATSSAPFTATFTFSEDVTGFDAGDIAVGNGSASNFAAIDASTYTALITPAADGSVTIDVAADAAQDAAGNGNTAAAQASSTYDGTPPNLAISGVPAATNTAFTATFTFTEDVTGFDLGDITVGNGAASGFTAIDGATYTALITPAADGTVTIDVAADLAQDAAGSGNLAATQATSTFDGTGPTVAISGVPALTNAPFTATFTFSENVSGFAAADINVGNGAASGFTAMDGATYTALITPTADGAVTIDVAADVAQDAATNGNLAATRASGTYDATPPVISVPADIAANTDAGQPTGTVTYAVTATDNIDGAVAVTLTAGQASGAAFPIGTKTVTHEATDAAGNTNTASFTVTVSDRENPVITAPTGTLFLNTDPGLPTATASYTVSASDNSGLVVTPVLESGPAPGADLAIGTHNVSYSATDASGNHANIAFTIEVQDTEAPVLTVPADIAQLTDTGHLTAVVTYAAPTATDNSGGAVTVAMTTGLPSGSAFPLGVTTVTYTATDATGNADTKSFDVTISPSDTVAPTLVISGVPALTNAPFTATFTFNETVTGFDASDIAVGNGTASGFSTIDDATYTALISPTTDGIVTIDVAANAALDLGLNGSETAIQALTVFDGTGPSVTISGVPATSSAPFTATITFSEDVTGFDASDITVGNGTASNLAAIDGATYSALITPTADGTVTIDVTADVAQDAAGNGNNAAAQASSTYDGTGPSVVISGASGTINGAFTATFTFSENVTGFAASDITASNAIVSGFAGSGTTYTAKITPSFDGAVTLDVAADTANDGFGNGNAAAAQFAVTFDGTRPTVAISGLPATLTAASTATFTFSEAVTGFALSDIVVGNGAASGFTGSGTTYTALITPAADGAVTIDVADGAAQDAAGNGNPAAAQVTSSFDGTAPTIAAITRKAPTGSATSADVLEFTIAFSESVVNVTADDFTVGGTTATVTAVSASSGSSIEVTISGGDLATLNGTVTLGIAAAQDITDVAGVALANTTPTGANDNSFDVSNDVIAPALAEVTAVPTPTQDSTPDYTFSSSEAGTISYGGNCSSASTAATAGNNTITFAALANGVHSNCTITVTDGSGNASTALPVTAFAIEGAPASMAQVAGDSQSAIIETSFATALGVKILDTDGKPVPGVTVSYSVPASGASGTLSSPTAVTGADGVASVTLRANDVAGSFDVTARVAGLGEVKFKMVNNASGPNSMSATAGTPQETTIKTTFKTRLTVTVLDAVGVPVQNVDVTFSAPASGASATLSAASATTDANGRASVRALANAEPGEYVVVASTAGLKSVNFKLTNGRDRVADIKETQRVIRNFVARRGDQITANDPDLIGRLNFGGAPTGGPVGFSGSGTLSNAQLAFSVSLRQMLASSEALKAKRRAELGAGLGLRKSVHDDGLREEETAGFDIWAQGKWTHVDGESSDSDIGFLYFGADYHFNSSLLIGVLAQFDLTDQTNLTENTAAEGLGWMVGPYLVARLHDNLIFDGRFAWGRSDNEIDALGLGRDDFSTSRWLVRGRLTGDFNRGSWRINPHVGVIYFEEEQKEYVDSMGNVIPSQTIHLGRMTFGPKVSYAIKTREGTSIAPHASIKGIWDFARTPQTSADGVVADQGAAFHARIEGGATVSTLRGLTLTGQGFYDGIGDESFQAYGGRFGVRVNLN